MLVINIKVFFLTKVIELLPDDLSKRVILSVTNKEVHSINEKLINRWASNGDDSESRIYLSADSIAEKEGINPNYFPAEFLNTLTIGGLPAHKLELRRGCPLILLRNLDTKKGLVNGTRLIVRRMFDRVLDCEVMNGFSKGSRVFIPRITCTSLSTQLPFSLQRKQFPVQLCFAMTINKAQGQSVEKVGIYLKTPVKNSLSTKFNLSNRFSHMVNCM